MTQLRAAADLSPASTTNRRIPPQCRCKWRRRALDRNDQGHSAASQIGSQCRQSVETTLGPAIFDRDVAAFEIAGFGKWRRGGSLHGPCR
jgi:hypothetical protein